MKIIPLSTRLSSTRGFQCDLGKKGGKRAICASVNQKRSLMSPLLFEAVNHAAPQKSMHPDPIACEGWAQAGPRANNNPFVQINA